MAENVNRSPDTYVAKNSTKHNTWTLIPMVYNKR